MAFVTASIGESLAGKFPDAGKKAQMLSVQWLRDSIGSPFNVASLGVKLSTTNADIQSNKRISVS